MKLRNLVGACLEMSQSEAHPHARKAQLFGPGEKNKLIGAARMLPKPAVQAVLKRYSEETLPLAKTNTVPAGYGCETTVFHLPQAEGSARRVLKLFHAREEIESVMNEYLKCQNQMQTYFPDLVEPTNLFIYQGRFANEPCLAAVQKHVDGVCLFEEGRTAVCREDVLKLHEGTRRMAAERGCVPDFSGGRNVLVDAAGRLRIVDCGFPVAIDDIDITYNLRPHLEWLATAAQATSEAQHTAYSV